MTNLRTPVALAFAALVAVAGIGIGAESIAAFSDADTVDGPAFSSGTIRLDATRVDTFNLALGQGWLPGDSVTGAVDVGNDGTLALRYSLATATTGVAGPNGGVVNSALLVEVRTIDATTPASRCGEFDGGVLQASEPLGSANVLFGAVSATDPTGDRAVPAGATDVLCIRVALPLATGNAFQGATAVTTFTFDAEQTADD